MNIINSSTQHQINVRIILVSIKYGVLIIFHFRFEDLYSFKLKFTHQLTVLGLKINLGTGNEPCLSEKPVTQHLNKAFRT